MSEKIKKKYADALVAGAAVRDSNGKVISESLETIDSKASLLDNVVVTEVDSVINKVRPGGTIITVGEIDEEDIQAMFAQEPEPEPKSLQLSYMNSQQQQSTDYELVMSSASSDANNDQTSLTLSYMN